MNLGIKGKVALVTAASRGLGFACAQALAAEGAKVAIAARHKKQLTKAAAKLVLAHKTTVVGIQADLTREKTLKHLVQQTDKQLGPIDILVMSTGHLPSGSFGKVSDKDWDLGLNLTIRPATALAKLVLPGMRKRKFGRIILLSSIFAFEPDPGFVISSTYRAGLSAFAKCLSDEVAADGVTVNVVAPGYFDTPLLRELAKKRAANKKGKNAAKKVLAAWGKLSPTGRLGSPMELGAFVAFLSAQQSSFFQGITAAIDGGVTRGTP